MTAAFVATSEQRKTVRAMAAFGIPQMEIANVVGISDRTLRKVFREELDKAATEANAKVAEVCFRMATSGNVPAATFFFSFGRSSSPAISSSSRRRSAVDALCANHDVDANSVAATDGGLDTIERSGNRGGLGSGAGRDFRLCFFAYSESGCEFVLRDGSWL